MNEMTGNQGNVGAVGMDHGAPQTTLHEHQSLTQNQLNVAPTGRNLPATINHEPWTIESMGDVPMILTFEVGRTTITIKQLMELNKGSFVPLRNVSVDTIDVCVSGQIIALAEVIGLQQWYGIRMGEVEIPPTLDLGQL